MVNGISLTEDIIRLWGENQYRLVLVNCMITLGRVKYMDLRAISSSREQTMKSRFFVSRHKDTKIFRLNALILKQGKSVTV